MQSWQEINYSDGRIFYLWKSHTIGFVFLHAVKDAVFSYLTLEHR